MSEHDREFGLVMPFVVCQSKDGPYEDQAYTAGYEAGIIDEALRTMAMLGGAGFGHRLVHAENMPQVDLLAMRHGFKVTIDRQSDSWCEVTFEVEE